MFYILYRDGKDLMFTKANGVVSTYDKIKNLNNVFKIFNHSEGINGARFLETYTTRKDRVNMVLTKEHINKLTGDYHVIESYQEERNRYYPLRIHESNILRVYNPLSEGLSKNQFIDKHCHTIIRAMARIS